MNFVTNARFNVVDPEIAETLRLSVWGIVDECRGFTTYAPVTVDDKGEICPDWEWARTFWDDQLERI